GPGTTYVPAPLVDPADLALGATSMAHVATSLSLAGPDPGRTAPPDAVTTAVPPRDVGPGDALALVAARRSVRTFDRDPLPLEEVSAVLRLAAGPPPVASRATRVHVVTSRVQGVAPGVAR